MTRLILFAFVLSTQFFGQSKLAVSKKNSLEKSRPTVSEFDKIIVSLSSCYEGCTILDIMIDKNGSVVFLGEDRTSKKGLYTGLISADTYKLIQNNFANTNIDNLKPYYRASATDQQTISVTFIKNNKIYKTVSDYGGAVPAAFKKAYIQVANLYKQLQMVKVQEPDYLKYIDLQFRRENMILDIKKSERFLLRESIRLGKQKLIAFPHKFIARIWSDDEQYHNIYTDGRYFNLTQNGKASIIDIGYNFYDVNKSHWAWKVFSNNGIRSTYDN